MHSPRSLRAPRRPRLLRVAAFAAPIIVSIGLPRVGLASPQTCAQSAERVQDLRSDKKLLDAKKEALSCAANECPKAVRADCSQWLDELDKLIPGLIFRVKGDGKVLTDVRVTLDGKPLVDKLDGGALPIDPGVHKVVYEAAGFETLQTEVLIAEGEKTHLEEIVLKRPAPLVTAPVTAPAPVKAADENHGNQTLRYASYGVGGAGIVTLGVFTVLEIGAQSSFSDFKKQPCAATSTCAQSDADHVHGKFVPPLVVGAVGLAAVGTGVVMFVLSGNANQEKAPPAKTAFHYGLAPSWNGAAATVGGTF